MDVEAINPIVIKAGKRKKKDIKKLEKGEGKLMTVVQSAVEGAVTRMGLEGSGEAIVPVVVVVRARPRKRKGPGGPLLAALRGL